jgi:hypothetical protein
MTLARILSAASSSARAWLSDALWSLSVALLPPGYPRRPSRMPQDESLGGPGGGGCRAEGRCVCGAATGHSPSVRRPVEAGSPRRRSGTCVAIGRDAQGQLVHLEWCEVCWRVMGDDYVGPGPK